MCVYVLGWQPPGGHDASRKKSSARFPAPPLGTATVIAWSALGEAGLSGSLAQVHEAQRPCPLRGPSRPDRQAG